LPKVSLALFACAAGAAGGFFAGALRPEPAVPRAERQAPAPPPSPLLEETLLRVRALEARLAATPLRESPRRTADPDEPRAGAPAAPTAPGGGAEVAGPAFAPGRPFGFAESEALFARLARERGSIGDLIARLEEEIRRHPNDADLHVALATAYAAKTAFATPPGPEQGTVWAKAERAYEEAIRLDPGHWQARYGKAFGDSMAPEFVGLRPRAIRQFEELLEIQEGRAVAPEHAEVYLRLGTLYKDAGNVARAREVWQRGLARMPDETRIAEALALVEEK
jgi:tetratricopeptide (TPR) repeat protein